MGMCSVSNNEFSVLVIPVEHLMNVLFISEFFVLTILNSSLLMLLVRFVSLLSVVWLVFFQSFSWSFSFNRWPAMCIHGDKSQPERDWVLNGMSV